MKLKRCKKCGWVFSENEIEEHKKRCDPDNTIFVFDRETVRIPHDSEKQVNNDDSK